MEETGILENPALLSLVSSRFLPNPQAGLDLARFPFAPPIPSVKSLKSAQAAVRYNRKARTTVGWIGPVDERGGAAMTHVHSLRFETLEARQLLSMTHVAVAMPRAAAPPFVLNGTLTVDNNPDASSTIRNGEGFMTTSVPVAGQLGTVGQVHGIWEETVGAHGDYYQAPDELILRDSKGSFVVAFTQPAHTKAPASSAMKRQVVLGGTGAYARASERGSIEVTTNAARTQVVSLTLQTRNT